LKAAQKLEPDSGPESIGGVNPTRAASVSLQEKQADIDLAASPVSWPRTAAHDGWRDWPDAVERLWSERRQITRWTLAGFLVSAMLAIFYPKYDSTAQIMSPDSASPGLAALALPSLSKSSGSPLAGFAGLASELLGARNSTAVFIKILESRTVADALINRFDLRKRYNVSYWDKARTKLKSRTAISEDKKSGVITLSVSDHDPKIAMALTEAYIDELNLVVARVSTSSARREREFIEQRLNDEKKMLEDSEKQFSRFASNTMTLDVPQQTKVTVEAAAKLQGEMIAARAELEGLEQIYTNENYRVRVMHGRVAELERELAKINAGPISTGSAQDPTNPYPSVKSLPQLGVEWLDLYRSTRIHETVFELLTQQYEVAKIQEAKEIPTVKVLDPPSVPERRHPLPISVLAVGTLVAAALACTSVFLRDRWENWNSQDRRRILLERIYQGSRVGLENSIHRFRPSHRVFSNGASAEPKETAEDQRDEEHSNRSL